MTPISSGESFVLVEEHGPVLLVTLNRLLKRNALTLDMYRQLQAAFDHAKTRDDLRVVVIAGQKGIFCAGNDLNEFAAVKTADERAPIYTFLRTLADFEKPVFAAVDGLAVGIGVTLLFHCDYVVATPEARFSSAFTDLALVPEAGSSLLAPQLMGYQRAFELLVMGDAFDAQRAYQAGLVNRIVPAETLRHDALRAAQNLARKSSASVRLSRKLLRTRETLHERMEHEFEIFRERLASDEAHAAIAKFLGRQIPG